MFIDQLEMLEAKTKGNLNRQEDGLLKQALAALHMAFVEAVDAPAAGPLPRRTRPGRARRADRTDPPNPRLPRPWKPRSPRRVPQEIQQEILNQDRVFGENGVVRAVLCPPAVPACGSSDAPCHRQIIPSPATP